MYKNIRIVLVETSHPGNIGAAARAMKNMHLQNLVLVKPQEYPSGKARARAAGAVDVLESARVVDNLDEALADCSLVLGASARERKLGIKLVDPRQAAEQIMTHGEDEKIAILFGREKCGLSNEELERCHYHIYIPSNEEYSSLNIAASVQVICYELNMAFRGNQSAPLNTKPKVDEAERPASVENMERMYQHMESVLIKLGMIYQDNPMLLMRRIRNLYTRAGMDQREVKMQRGIMTAIEKLYKQKAGE
ncbi:MAG TPA: RNA methyltransferase [Gammaproteobacteria bacterium]|nr:RNA methyltransferase [Gammaproteobacteria bacterium]